MAIEFLPNQPIIFVDDTQSCLNNDNQLYSAPLQAGDVTCMQVKQSSCGFELMCTVTDDNSELTANPGFNGDASGW